MSTYMVRSPSNGKMRRYKVSDYTKSYWISFSSQWPAIAIPALQDAFEQEIERLEDACSWSGSSVRNGDTLKILLDLFQKKADGEF